MDQAVASLLASISHRRLRCYEHETTEGPRSDGTAAYFVIFADFDVEAYTEEKAADLVDEVLDAVSTDDIQYFSHGLLPGEQRVRPARRTSAQEEQEEHNEQNAQEEGRGRRSSRGGRRRGTRDRGREQTDEAAIASAVIDETLPDPVEAETARPSDTPRADLLVDATASTEDPEALIVTEQSYQQDQLDQLDQLDQQSAHGSQDRQVEEFDQNDQVDQDEQTGLVEIPLDFDHDLPARPPVRSSAAMQTKTSVTLRASELGLSPKGTLPGEEELIVLATAEARRRHPALPGDTAPESEITTLPWGDVVLTLTWSDDVPVPSADDGE
jgi:hypothetical protein